MVHFRNGKLGLFLRGCSPIPTSISYFLVFLVMQINSCNYRSTFDAIIVGVAWAHKKMSFPSPTDHTLAKQLISSVHGMLASLAVNRNLPLLRSHLKMLTEKCKFASLDFFADSCTDYFGLCGFPKMG